MATNTKTKAIFEVIVGVITIVVGSIAIYQFLENNGGNVRDEARLQEIANVVRDLTGNQVVQLPQNYDVPFRRLLREELLAIPGVDWKASDKEIINVVKPGYVLFFMEIQEVFYQRYGKKVFVDVDSSVISIYQQLYND